MVLIMTMTPVHMTAHGHHVESVGLVISAHTFGMFALSPLSGRFTDRFGSPTVIAAGLIVTASASILAAVAPPDGGVLLFLALFLLGYGWNLGFVAGSTMLTHGVDIADRTRLQGAADSLIWTSSALASLSSGDRPRVRELRGARAPRRRPDRDPALALRVAADGAHRRHVADQPAAELRDDPCGEDPGAVGDLGQRDALVGAVGDLHVARAEDHRRRVALVDEQPHVGAVRLAEQRRPAAERRLGGRGERHRQRMVGRDARRRELAAGQLEPDRVVAQERVGGAGGVDAGPQVASASRHVWPSFTP